jgi:hypothetical protein
MYPASGEYENSKMINKKASKLVEKTRSSLNEVSAIISNYIIGDKILSPDGEFEIALRQRIPVFINSYNQFTYLRDTLNWFYKNEFKNCTVIDNNSNLPLLIEFFESDYFIRNFNVIRLKNNVGPYKALKGSGFPIHIFPYIFTDPDLLLPEDISDTFLTSLFNYSVKYKTRKVGLALDISDVSNFKKIQCTIAGQKYEIFEWEQRFWKILLENNVYRASVDTTFHIYNPNITLDKRRLLNEFFDVWPMKKMGFSLMTDIRVAGNGFTAKHRPWYEDDGWPPDERDFYRKSSENWSTWLSESTRFSNG